MVIKFEMRASEYWAMTPAEVGRHLEENRPKHIGGIHEDDFERLKKRRQELKDQGVNVA
jgi:hypothetical protein